MIVRPRVCTSRPQAPHRVDRLQRRVCGMSKNRHQHRQSAPLSGSESALSSGECEVGDGLDRGHFSLRMRRHTVGTCPPRLRRAEPRLPQPRSCRDPPVRMNRELAPICSMASKCERGRDRPGQRHVPAPKVPASQTARAAQGLGADRTPSRAGAPPARRPRCWAGPRHSAGRRPERPSTTRRNHPRLITTSVSASVADRRTRAE